MLSRGLVRSQSCAHARAPRRTRVNAARLALMGKRDLDGMFFECLDASIWRVIWFLLQWTRIYNSFTISEEGTRERSQARWLCIKKRKTITVSTRACFIDLFDRRNFSANHRGNRKRKKKPTETGQADLGPSRTFAETFFDLSLL